MPLISIEDLEVEARGTTAFTCCSTAYKEDWSVEKVLAAMEAIGKIPPLPKGSFLLVGDDVPQSEIDALMLPAGFPIKRCPWFSGMTTLPLEVLEPPNLEISYRMTW